MFSVGREEVRASDATATLTPTSPRAERQGHDDWPAHRSVDEQGILGQLFFSGSSWDDIGGEWGFSSAEVAMMLTPPYLSKVSTGSSTVPMVVPALALRGSSTGSDNINHASANGNRHGGCRWIIRRLSIVPRRGGYFTGPALMVKTDGGKSQITG